jgi:hypothetical protein
MSGHACLQPVAQDRDAHRDRQGDNQHIRCVVEARQQGVAERGQQHLHARVGEPLELLAFNTTGAPPGRSLRANWEGGATRVNVNFAALGEAKSQAALARERLPDAETAEAMKAYWRERVAVLKRVLEA